MNFSFDQDIDVSVETALRAYGTPSFYEGRPTVDNISVLEVVDHQDRGDRSVIEVRFRFVGSVSPAVRAVVDPAKMSWITRSEILPEEGRMTFTILPDHYPDRLTSHGEHCFVSGAAPDTAIVTVEGELSVHVPLVGRSVEKVIVSGVRSYIADEMAGLPDVHPLVVGGRRNRGLKRGHSYGHNFKSCDMPSSIPWTRTSRSSVVS